MHVNSDRETLDLFSLGIYANYNNLRDFEWSVTSNNNIITGFERNIVSKSLPLVICCDENKATDIKNKLYEHFEKDVLNKKSGYFIINNYKFNCYVIRSIKSNYLISKRVLYVTLDIVSDEAFWTKETYYTLPRSNRIATREINNIKKYTYQYPFTYSSLRNVQVIDSGFASSDVIIRFFGYCENPYVNIKGKIYQVFYACERDEYIEINTKDRTVFKIGKLGEKTNIFNYRDKQFDDFFRKIEPGDNQVAWDGTYDVEIVVLERRSEPKWN